MVSKEVKAEVEVPRPETNLEKYGTGRKPDAVKSLMLEGWLVGVQRLNAEIANPDTSSERIQELLEWFHKWTMLKEPEPQATLPAGPSIPGLQPYGIGFVAFQPPAPRELPVQTPVTAPATVVEDKKTQA